MELFSDLSALAMQAKPKVSSNICRVWPFPEKDKPVEPPPFEKVRAAQGYMHMLHAHDASCISSVCFEGYPLLLRPPLPSFYLTSMSACRRSG